MKRKTSIIIATVSAILTFGSLAAFVPRHCHGHQQHCGAQTEHCQTHKQHTHHHQLHEQNTASNKQK